MTFEPRPADRPRVLPSRAGSIALVVLAGLWLAVADAHARSTGAPLNKSHEPPDNEDCTRCHDEFTLNDPAGEVVLELVDAATLQPVTEYVPGGRHAVAFRLGSGRADRRRWGFQAVPLTGAAQMAGSFPAPTNPDYQVLVDGGLAREYVTHTALGTNFGSADGQTWFVDWTAPDTDVGQVTFYACGNTANGNSNNEGDYIGCTTFALAARVEVQDSDGDGLTDDEEAALGTAPDDADSDDDGVIDGDEVVAGTDPLDCDTDGDTLPDGLEMGVDMPHADTAAAGCFVPDADPTTTTDPLNVDSDGDGAGCWDGEEDADGNGAVDAPAETDPNDPGDCPVAGATSLLRVARLPDLASVPTAFLTVPCTTPSDVRLCGEAATVTDFPDSALPRSIGDTGALVLLQWDADTTVDEPTQPPADNLIQVRRGATGEIVVSLR